MQGLLFCCGRQRTCLLLLCVKMPQPQLRRPALCSAWKFRHQCRTAGLHVRPLGTTLHSGQMLSSALYSSTLTQLVLRRAASPPTCFCCCCALFQGGCVSALAGEWQRCGLSIKDVATNPVHKLRAHRVVERHTQQLSRLSCACMLKALLLAGLLRLERFA